MHESKGVRETVADEIDSIGRSLLWPSKHDEWQAKKFYMQISTIATLPGLKDDLKYFFSHLLSIFYETGFRSNHIRTVPNRIYLIPWLLQYAKLVVRDLRPLQLIIKLHFVPQHETQF